MLWCASGHKFWNRHKINWGRKSTKSWERWWLCCLFVLHREGTSGVDRHWQGGGKKEAPEPRRLLRHCVHRTTTAFFLSLLFLHSLTLSCFSNLCSGSSAMVFSLEDLKQRFVRGNLKPKSLQRYPLHVCFRRRLFQVLSLLLFDSACCSYLLLRGR